MKRAYLLLIVLLLSGCSYVAEALDSIGGSYRTQRRPPDSLLYVEDGTTNVHVIAACATLTPSVDYRDFMPPGSVAGPITTTLVGHSVPGFPTPNVDPLATVLPPEKATLVFDNTELCN